MRPAPPGARFALAGAVLAAVAAVAGGVLIAPQNGERPGTRTLVAAVAPAPGQLPRFEELAGRAGIAIRHRATGCSGNVAGAAWADVNRDGLLDLFLPQYGGPSRLWVARGRRNRFRLEAVGRGIPDAGFATVAVFADYDNDGDQDLYVVRHGPNSLYENDGRGHFRDIARLVGVADPGRGSSAAFADFDRDGRLDLYVANGDNCGRPVAAPDRLYRNRGGGFEDVTRDLHGSDAGEGIGLQTTWLDYDRDGDPDLYLANDHLGFRGNELWRNDGGSKGRWRFTAVGASSGADLRLSGRASRSATSTGTGGLTSPYPTRVPRGWAARAVS